MDPIPKVAFPSLERRLLDAAKSDIDSARSAAQHLIGAGGKRVRPQFAALLGDLFGSTFEDAESIGLAAELVHTATLLHDDVIDQGETRRGKSATHIQYGTRAAVLAGDFLLAKALHSLTERGLFAATHELTVAVRELVEAELLQSEQAFLVTTTLEQTRRIAEGKTGALFAWCARGLAVTLALSAEQVAAANRLGRAIGYAFQVSDDLLDIHGQGSGKPSYKDLHEGKITVPVQLARVKDPGLEMLLVTAFESRQDADFAKAYARLDQNQAFATGQEELRHCHEQILKALTAFTREPHVLERWSHFFNQDIAFREI